MDTNQPMNDCILETLRMDDATIKGLLEIFVDAELCQCAKETFNATPEMKDAIFYAVINEMVLRSLSEHMENKK